LHDGVFPRLSGQPQAGHGQDSLGQALQAHRLRRGEAAPHRLQISHTLASHLPHEQPALAIFDARAWDAACAAHNLPTSHMLFLGASDCCRLAVTAALAGLLCAHPSSATTKLLQPAAAMVAVQLLRCGAVAVGESLPLPSSPPPSPEDSRSGSIEDATTSLFIGKSTVSLSS
jgi:hypothetical protein